MDNFYKQLGENSKFPTKIITWKFGERVPTWLSDVAAVKFLDGDGNITLDYLETSKGGVELKMSGSSLPLVRLSSKNDIVCTGEGKLFSLTEYQLALLYERVE